MIAIVTGVRWYFICGFDMHFPDVCFFLIEQVWCVTLCKFKVYNLLLWYIYMLYIADVVFITLHNYCLYSLYCVLDLWGLFTTCYKFVP